jgi:hypothetical protein
MANEVQIRNSLRIKIGNIEYQSNPTAFNADMFGENGPSPGSMNIPTDGRDIYFEELVTPGWCFMQNLDDDNYVEYGIKDPQTGVFYPLGELGPAETTVFQFSRNLQEQYTGSGTGTTGPENYFHIKANVAACKVLIQAFEK